LDIMPWVWVLVTWLVKHSGWAKPICGSFCESCYEDVTKYTGDNLPHNAQYFIWAMINASAAVWEYFYFQATVRSYDYRGLLSNHQYAYEAGTVFLILGVIGFNLFSGSVCLKSHTNSAYKTMKFIIILVAITGHYLV